MAAGPFVRVLANVLMVGFSVFSRAFIVAYQQALQNARTGGGAASAAAAAARSVRGKISMEESLQILNIEKSQLGTMGIPELKRRYDHLFKANDPESGGSFYLQSKVFRAQERLMQDLNEIVAEAKTAGVSNEKK